MSDYVVAKRYARALFEVAQEAGSVESTAEQLRIVAELWEQAKDFRSFMSHPGVPNASKMELVKQATGSDLSELVSHTLELLIERGRFSIVPALYQTFVAISDEQFGRAKALVYSAYELTEADRKAVAEHFGKLTGKQLSIENQIDKSLIGGIRVRIGDRLYDGSVAGKLEQLHNQLKQNA